MSSFIKAIKNPLVIGLIVISVVLLVTSGRRALISFGDPVSFDDMLDGKKLEEGDYIKGEVLYTFGSYAAEDIVNENGTVMESNSKVYYVIPTNDEFVFYGLEVDNDTYRSLEKNADQTYDYVMNGGAQPTSCPEIEGWVKAMDDELEEYFVDWLEEYGYTKAEIKSMGEFLYIMQIDSTSDRAVAFVGLVLLGIAILVIILIASKDKRKNKMVSQSMIAPQMSNNMYGANNTYNNSYAANNTYNDPYAANNTYNDPYAANNTYNDPYAANNTYNDPYAANNTYNDPYASQNN